MCQKILERESVRTFEKVGKDSRHSKLHRNRLIETHASIKYVIGFVTRTSDSLFVEFCMV